MARKEKIKLFDIQPTSCRQIINIESNTKSKLVRRILSFDPTIIYEKLNKENLINPHNRYNNVSIEILFPLIENICACGCGKELVGRRKKWSTTECYNFAIAVQSIIYGKASYLRTIRKIILGKYICETCGIETHKRNLELDHIIPVKHGGGGCWLSNYAFKCKACHKLKTKKDFNWK